MPLARSTSLRVSSVLQIADFPLQRPEFVEAGDRQFDDRHQFGLAKRFNDIADDAGSLARSTSAWSE